MDTKLYMRYMMQYIKEAIDNSDGSNAGISGYLQDKKISGLLVQHREEKKRALTDAKQAFSEHRHWPIQIVLSQLGIDYKELVGGT